MKWRSLICATAVMVLGRAAVAQTAPVNDNCSGATPVVDGDNAISTKGSTLDTSPDCTRGGAAFAGPEVWYSYTAPETGLRNFEITVFQRNPAPPFGGRRESALAIYDACGGNVLACDANSGFGTYSKIRHFSVTAGTTYIIRVGNWGTPSELNKGIGTLNISAPRTPMFLDDCEQAMPIAGQADVPFTTAGLTNSDSYPWDCDIMHDGWLAWTPSLTGRAVIDACSDTDTLNLAGVTLSLYEGCGTVPVVACSSQNLNDPGHTACTPKLAYDVVAGNVYLIRFGFSPSSTNADVSGTIHLEVRPSSTAFQPPAGALIEPGNCDDAAAADVNGGCDAGPGTFTSLNLCDTYLGTVNGRRLPLDTRPDPVVYSVDTDWYKFTLLADDTLTLSGQTEFGLGTGSSYGGIYLEGCPPIQVSTLPDTDTGNTAEGVSSFTKSYTLSVGTYYLVIGPNEPTGNAGDCAHGHNRYWFTLSGSTPCTGACCTNAACTITTQAACTGTYQGNNSVCTATTCCAADFDHSGAVNVSDIFAFLRAWFAHSPSADIDGNSAVNVSDIFAFLRHWFAHC